MKKSLLLFGISLLFVCSCEQPSDSSDSTPDYVGEWYYENSTSWSLMTFTESTFNADSGSLGSSASSRVKGSNSVSGNILTINPEYSYNFTSSVWETMSIGAQVYSYVRSGNSLTLTQISDSSVRTYTKQ